MRSASSHKLSGLGLAMSLLVSSALAAPQISAWSLDTQGSPEKLLLRWNETGQVEINRFEQAKQVVAVVPGARLAEGVGRRLDASSSRVLDHARLQEVTLPSGEKAVQLTLDLRLWASVDVTPTADGLLLTLAAPADSQLPVQQMSLESGRGLELTDEKLAELGQEPFGAASAPVTGAGQAPAGALSNFYVPPDVERKRSLAATSSGDLQIETKLNEIVRRVDFQGTSLENVLRLISEQAELNILIKPSDVAGKTVTLRLRNVTLRQMMDAILKQNNLGYTIEDGGILRIVPRDQVKSTSKETVTETISINWVNAKDVADALKPFADKEDGTIQVFAASNQIVVRDVPENVQRIQDLIQRMDIPEKQVLIELRLVNMTETARRAFGVRTGVESRNVEDRFLRDPSANFFDNGQFTNSTNDLTRTLNNNLNSSVGGTTRNTFTHDFANDLLGGRGLTSGTNSTLTNTGTTDITQDLRDQLTNTLRSSSATVPTSRLGAGVLAPNATALQLAQMTTFDILGIEYDVDFQLNAQEERGEATVLANPTVLSLNNQEAMVEIKRKIPYVSAVNSDQGSVATIEFIDVGTEVQILPRITNNGYVQMQIQPEQIIDTGERPGGVPLTDERRVQASVIVKDEQTIALGGLREFSATAAETGVPYLLRLPVLSWLFKTQENRQNKTELYLFVTPHIVKDPTPTSYQMGLYDKIDYNWDLPDYYFDQVFARKAPGEETNPSNKKR